jgi:hypothetical protein
MADTRPTKVGFSRAIYLCASLIFAPKKFRAEVEKDNQTRKNFSDPPEKNPSFMIVRRAVVMSFWLVLVSVLIGYCLDLIAAYFLGSVSNRTIAVLQILGVSLLLWGTLFVRGWEIETYCGVTLTERVNQWLYRALYCIGTATLVFSVGWSQHSN